MNRKLIILLALGLISVGTFIAWYRSLEFDLDFTEKGIRGE